MRLADEKEILTVESYRYMVGQVKTDASKGAQSIPSYPCGVDGARLRPGDGKTDSVV